MSNSVRRMKRQREEDGFTLIEILITMFILGISLLALLSLFVYGFKILVRSNQVTVATQIAQEEIERIRNMSYTQLLSLDNPTIIDHELLEELDEGSATLNREDGPGEDIKKIIVSVTWMYKGELMERDMVTYVMRAGINKR